MPGDRPKCPCGHTARLSITGVMLDDEFLDGVGRGPAFAGFASAHAEAAKDSFMSKRTGGTRRTRQAHAPSAYSRAKSTLRSGFSQRPEKCLVGHIRRSLSDLRNWLFPVEVRRRIQSRVHDVLCDFASFCLLCAQLLLTHMVASHLEGLVAWQAQGAELFLFCVLIFRWVRDKEPK